MKLMENRNFMKCPAFTEALKTSDQALGKKAPPHGKEVKGELIELPYYGEVVESSYPVLLDQRRSLRSYDETANMTKAQLAYMLYTAQGIQEYRGKDESFTLRPVPSGGARHPFETYVAVRNVEGLQAGLYYYAPAANVGEKKVSISYMHSIPDYEKTMSDMLMGQSWATKAAAVLFLSCVPYRSEWRYKELSHRVVLIDLGHVGQNMMLSAVSLGLGSCCMAAYDQALCDKVLGLDGVDEYTVYALSVGKAKA